MECPVPESLEAVLRHTWGALSELLSTPWHLGESMSFISLSFPDPVPSHQHRETWPYVPSSKLQLYLNYSVSLSGRLSSPGLQFLPTS